MPGWVSFTALGPDGNVWVVSSDGAESFLTKWDADGADLATTRLGRLRTKGEFSVGPAGLATLATPSPPEPSAGAGDSSDLPTGRVAKDGYELRYGEPEGGITLWDIDADEAVYEFGPDVLASGEYPASVRQVDDGDGLALAFEDPFTGEELVRFTFEDLEAVEDDQLDAPDWPDMDMWVGWSTDGTDWGWQDARAAFNLGDVEAQVVVAVGSDYVIASVWAFTPVEASSSESRGPDGRDIIVESVEQSAESVGQRWFIARVP